MSGKALSAANNGDIFARKATRHGAKSPGKMRTFYWILVFESFINEKSCLSRLVIPSAAKDLSKDSSSLPLLKNDRKNQGAGSDQLPAPWCLLGCFVRTHSTVPCVLFMASP